MPYINSGTQAALKPKDNKMSPDCVKFTDYICTCIPVHEQTNEISSKKENISAISICIYHQKRLEKQNALRIFLKLILA